MTQTVTLSAGMPVEQGASASAQAPAAPAPAPRYEWVDAVRGFVVFMVVLMHLGIYHFLPMAEGTQAAGAWAAISDVMQLVRMPALLVLSGWLLSSRVRAGLFNRRTLHTVGANAYLYVLWLTIYAVVMSARGTTEFAHAPGWDSFWSHLLKPQSTLWFLAALIVYTVLLSLLRKVPLWITITALSVISWVSAVYLLPGDFGLWANIPQYAIFFALGVSAGPVVKAIGRRAWWALLGSVVTAAAGWLIALGFAYVGLPTYPLTLVMSVALVMVLFAIAAILARHLGVALRPAAWVGRRTLAVYVLHYPLLVILATTTNERVRELNEMFITSAANWVYPLVVTGLIVMVSVALQELADRIGLWWLFRLPSTQSVARSR